jgi:DNA replication protein DnaC
MSNYAQLKSQLKALKLSGIAETIELRIMEAQNNQLAFTELLAMILNDEIETRQNRKLQRLISHARLDAGKTVESFDFTFNPSINATLIRELATCRFIEKGENIFLIGPTGTGKTHIAQAISHMACRQMLTVEFYNFHDFFNAIHKADLMNKSDRLIKSLIKADLIVIDDFAFKKIDQKSAEYLYALVDARYRQKPIILTSNRAMNDWVAIFPDPVMANALMDRLAHNAHQIIIKGESFRKKYNKIQNA